MAGTGRAIARLEGLTHRHAGTLALDALSLEIPGDCLVGLIGPDGVGKSSLLGVVAGAKRIQQGKVEVLGGDMADSRHRSAICPRVAYMPQGLGKNLYADLSVRENIEFFARLFGQDTATSANGALRACSPAPGLRRSTIAWRRTCREECVRSSGCVAR